MDFLTKPDVQYAELRCKSCYSFLTGASQPRELIEQAAELNLSALALTDVNGVYGIPKAWCAKKKFSNLKLIVGAEVTMENLPPLTFLSKTRSGYGLLCRILTEAHKYAPKGMASLSEAVLWELIEQYPKQNDLFVLLDADPEILPKDQERLFYFFNRLLTFFSKDNFYLSLSRYLDGKDAARTNIALDLKNKFNINIVATNNVHFHLPQKKKLHDVLIAIRENTSLKNIGKKIFSNAERHLKTPYQMQELFLDMPQAIENTLLIAKQCSFLPSELRYFYPSEWIPPHHTAYSYLEELCWKGASERYPNGIPLKVEHQLRHELQLVNELKFADYFLTIWEIIQFAKAKKILCQGRGSAANSIICYCLFITSIDPVKMDLLFERFISAERGEPPDIDVDFEHERREEVIQHVYEKYGRHRAAMVCSVITYRTRSAIRDVSKALESTEACSLVEEIKGIPRHLSIHTGGFTLSKEPIIETVPIEPARMEGRTVIQWDKDDLAIIGLLKVDLLSLGMLTALRKSFDSLNNKWTIATLPPEDPETYEMIQNGDTVGVFQIESRAQMSMIRRLLPNSFYDLVIEIAIVRPGPIVGQMVHPYLKRRRGLEPVVYPHIKLKKILEKTLGVPLFQEQVMKIAIDIAGFTPGEADELRRAIGAWRSSGEIDKIGKRLMLGLRKAGLSEEFVKRIFLQLKGFAEYGFPESHSASFALLAYASAYLKCHYPSHFLCAILNSQPMGFYSVHSLIEDARRHGVCILPCDPQISKWDCSLEDDKETKHPSVRIGLRFISGLSEKIAKKIITERENGAFKTFSSFLERTRLSTSLLQTMAIGNVFQCFGLSQREALWQILNYRTKQTLQLYSLETSANQLGLFENLSDYESIRLEHQSLNLSAQGHPLSVLRKLFPTKTKLEKTIVKTTSETLKQLPHGSKIAIAGLTIVRQRPPTAKGTCFATLEDEFGFIDLILHPKVFEKYKNAFLETPFIIAQGKLQKDVKSISILIEKLDILLIEETQNWNGKKTSAYGSLAGR